MDSPDDRLTAWDHLWTWALAVLFVGFGVITEYRSAFAHRPMTDVQVYLRAAWAVRAGENPYQITDTNGWHYCYPPTFAILLTPLADAPPYADRGLMPPFAVSVAVWYVLSVVLLVVGVHRLATAYEERTPDRPKAWGRRWLVLRVLPIYACLGTVGLTLNRGQVNFVMLFALCLAMAATLRNQRWRAGAWVAAAVTLKLIPLVWAAVPFARGDWRGLLAGTVGLVVGLGLIPLAVFGPQRTVDYYKELGSSLAPGVGAGDNPKMAKELTDLTATHSQSVVAVLHQTIHFGREVPPEPQTWERVVHFGVCGALGLVTMSAMWWRRKSVEAAALGLPLCAIVMMLASPVSHQHYCCLLVPLIVALLARRFAASGRVRVGWPLGVLIGVNLVVSVGTQFDEASVARDLGAFLYLNLVFWGVGLAELLRTPKEPASRAP